MRRDDPGPYSLDRLAAMPTPQLFTVDAQAWKRRLVDWFEEETGRTLYPMQVEMLLIETLAYAMGVLGEEAQMVAEQHLVCFAGIQGLERLGPNRATPRLPPAQARTTLRFSIAAARPGTVLVPAGTRVGAADELAFATLDAVSIVTGTTFVDVAAEAITPGAGGNGFLAGQITAMLDPLPGVSVTNLTDSSGGADAEGPELYRLRLANAFERISTGGSYAWYRETAIGVSSAIIDVAIIRPTPCVIDIYPLTLAGAASPDLRAQVLSTFDRDEALDIRFGDDVFVKPPVAVTGVLVVIVRGRAMSQTVQADATAAANSVLKVWRERLGSVIAPSDIESSIKRLVGVIDVEVSGLPFSQLQPFEFLVPTSVTVNIVVLP